MTEPAHPALLSLPAPLIPVDSGVTALDPVLLAPMADAAVAELLLEGEASNTRRELPECSALLGGLVRPEVPCADHPPRLTRHRLAVHCRPRTAFQ
jgi:hypothetical protein